MTIIVSNLADDITENSLHELFAAYGNVTASRLAMDPITGNPQGFGIVIMDDATEGNLAVKQLNNQPYMQKNLLVTEAALRNNNPTADRIY